MEPYRFILYGHRSKCSNCFVEDRVFRMNFVGGHPPRLISKRFRFTPAFSTIYPILTFVVFESDLIRIGKSNFFILKDSTVRASFYSKEVYNESAGAGASSDQQTKLKDSEGS